MSFVLAPAGDARGQGAGPLRATLLGQFTISLGDERAGPWPRPTAKRLCELVLVSHERRVSREVAFDAIFPRRSRAGLSNALSVALSNARTALAPLGNPASSLLQADRNYVWVNPYCPIEIDLDLHKERLRRALSAQPGLERDDLLLRALADEGTLLEDEPYADWALFPREQLERARQGARLTLAKDRATGWGRGTSEAVTQAWEACFFHDPTSEEAAFALMRLYAAQLKWGLVETTYNRCRSALEELGVTTSPALERARAANGQAIASARSAGAVRGTVQPDRDRDQRIVTCVFIDLGAPPAGGRLGPEDLSERVGNVLAETVGSVESFGGIVTAVSGAGLVALFGTPTAHEDDPERGLRAAYRVLGSVGAGPEGFSMRAGIETGRAVVGPLLGGGPYYGAFGEVVATAAALQSVTRVASVLVGPATHAATAGLFDWGPTEEVTTVPGGKPLLARYLERPKARPAGQAGRRGLAGRVPVVGRERELNLLRGALKDATVGKGGAVFITGEPGLGKTRLVEECRKLFIAWVGAASGRLPLWLEGRAASYATSRPYGLYQQLLSAWVGVAPEESPHDVRAALERALQAIFGDEAGKERAQLLSVPLGIAHDRERAAASQLTPEQLQQAIFETVRAVVSRLVAYGPTVLVLEDLHWADPTSIRLTEELVTVTKEGPLLLVMSRRPEPDPGVSALETTVESDPSVRLRRVQLSPLIKDAERDLVISLLGEGTADEVLSAVSKGAGGNPLFIEERLSSLLETGALAREKAGWRIDPGVSVEIPEAIERLVRSRVDRLAPDPRQAIVAASVLGQDFATGALRAVTDLGGALESAVLALCSGGLLVELRNGPETSYRFRHSLIQEATYKGLLRNDRQRLHARAAWDLEASSSGRLEEVASVLGHHFALAGETGRAVHYLEMAGDDAASAFANDEAVASYRYALDLLGREGLDPTGRASDGTVKVESEIRSKMATVLLLTGRYSEASEMLEQALAGVDGGDRLQAARLHNRLGWTELDRHKYVVAAGAFEAASTRLGHVTQDTGPEILDLWLESQLGKAEVHYWQDEPDQMAAVLASVGPVFDAGREPPHRRADYLSALFLWQLTDRRHRVDDEILENAQKALVAKEEFPHAPGFRGRPREVDIAWSVFNLGFCLLWYGDLHGAEERLTAALHVADRTGSAGMRALAIFYLNLAALRRNDPAAVGLLAPQAVEAAYAASRPQYAATGKASLAWRAWKTGRVDEVEARAEEALSSWPASSWQPFHWVCLWPLIGVRLASGRVTQAVEAARQLLPAPQQRLPDELESEVRAAIEAWDHGEPERARQTLVKALEIAQQLRFA